ncbi:hypothetical protein AOL_s00054g855 [Orbilia oligospora ATCC 24927]|uniref:Clr5 domain-containing protein n=1 Tax=Arthrobotrys oligospora (strain ATCC 24927 / CBS 115.81 / DSM 1491) TaxID=756982 RepID=G1X7W9_ARTOA|nr:hypothetical protein AOL_s00054g855 [Orbilia oligospora ATCC 24927]EGX50769.1 hypothetical protein AOL_s00054g855 [Orbilia oligospora ATCC 24927]
MPKPEANAKKDTKDKPKAKDPFQQGHHTSVRPYRNNYSQLELDIIADGISRQASNKEILESLAPHGDWNENRLKYATGNRFSRKNLKSSDAAFIVRECKRAEKEGRPIPRFRHLGRSGQRVKDRVIKRILKEEHKYDSINLDESEEPRKVRVEEPGEEYIETNYSEGANVGPFEERDGYFELIPAAVPSFDTFGASSAGAVLSERQTTTTNLSLQGRYLEALDPSWVPLEPNNELYPVGDGSMVQFRHDTAVPTDWGPEPSDNIDLAGWLRESSDTDLETLDVLMKNLALELKNNWEWIESQTGSNQALVGPGRFGAPNDSSRNLGPTDSSEVWSEQYLPRLNHWINTAQVIALEGLARIIAERKKSGIQNLYTCYENLVERCEPIESLFVYYSDWNTSKMVPPPHILFSLFESPDLIPLEIRKAFRNNLVEIDIPSPDVLELESQELRRIFKANFSGVVRTVQAHRKNEYWSKGLKSTIVHLLTIEERLGHDNYLLIQAIFRFATVMERAELHGINDKDIIPLLFILLNKLSRLKLEDSPIGDIPHALIHLYRSLVRIRHFSGAKTVLMRYRKDKKKLGPWDEELYQNKMMMMTAMELLHSKDERQRAKGLRYLRQVVRFFDKRTNSLPMVLRVQGTSVASFDFLQMGKYLRFAGSAGEAITSFLISIEHSSRFSGYELSPRKYEGVFELGLCYEIIGLPLKALECFNDDYEYRKRIGLLDTADLTREALRRNLQKCSLSQQVRPTNRMIQQASSEKYLYARHETCTPNYKDHTYLDEESSFITTAEGYAASFYHRLDEENGLSPDVVSTTIGILEYIDPRTDL